MYKQFTESKQHNDMIIEIDDDDIILFKTVTKPVTKSKLKVATKPNSGNKSDGKSSLLTKGKCPTRSWSKKGTDTKDPALKTPCKTEEKNQHQPNQRIIQTLKGTMIRRQQTPNRIGGVSDQVPSSSVKELSPVLSN